MTDSPSEGAKDVASTPPTSNIPQIPIEIVSDEEMALIEAAFAATRSCLSSSAIPSRSSSFFRNNVRSIASITSLSKKRFSSDSTCESDIEDFNNFNTTPKKNRAADSLFRRFRKRSGLSVTDITSTEWCEKQMEFVLQFGQRKVTKAMKAGLDRHVKLEEEVVKKVKVSIESVEDAWALKLLNFITCANQLLFEGLTREIPVVGVMDGIWIVGIVDEIRMPEEGNKNPMLVDTKTRVRDTLPAEPQRRNGRLQLMCYKRLWDNSVDDKFPCKEFFEFFSLNPHYILSKEIRDNAAKAGIPVMTLDEVMRCYRNTCHTLLPADNQLLLRYELQKDNSVIGEDQFAFDPDWLSSQIQGCLEFWLGEREANFTPEEERWKCGYCQFAKVCCANIVPPGTSSSPVKINNPRRSPSPSQS